MVFGTLEAKSTSENKSPLQAVCAGIDTETSGLGITLTTISKEFPTHPPLVGVTVYVTFSSTFNGFVFTSVWLIDV